MTEAQALYELVARLQGDLYAIANNVDDLASAKRIASRALRHLEGRVNGLRAVTAASDYLASVGVAHAITRDPYGNSVEVRFPRTPECPL